MKKIALSVEEIKKIEQKEFIRLGNSYKLMEKAGIACAKIILNHYKERNFTVVCGPGNNGGDGFVISNYLNKHKKNVNLYCLKKIQYKKDALKAYKNNKLKKINLENLSIKKNFVIVDCLFGIGLNKKIKGIFKKTITKINKSNETVISIDIPSGIYGDNGKVMGNAIKANLTLALHAKKIGHNLFPGNKYSGKIKTVDLGIN